jgi:uncharacterized protein (TIGR02001 family)
MRPGAGGPVPIAIGMKGLIMNKAVAAALIAVGLSGLPAAAADLGGKMATKAPPVVAVPSPWDFAFGAAVMNDYVFRGISQSAEKPSVAAYGEFRYNVLPSLQLYAGGAAASIDFPNHAAAEVDFYAGFRPTFDKLSLDFGFWYYWYPGGQLFDGLTPQGCTNLAFSPNGGGCNVMKSDVSYWEVYAKASYALNDIVTPGATVFYSPSWLNTGAYGLFASGTLKVNLPSNILPPDVGWFVSGEFGYYWFGTTDAFYFNTKLPDYATWNIGLALTYKVFTVDLRYHDTNLSKGDCNVLSGDHTAVFDPSTVSVANPAGLSSNWCGSRFVAKFSADITLGSLK